METVATALKSERKLSDSTVNQYIMTLKKLNKGVPFKSFTWAKKYDDVQEIIDTYAKSTQGNQYTVLVSAMSIAGKSYKAAYKHWSDKMYAASEDRKANHTTERNEKQMKNWMSLEEIEEKKRALKNELDTIFASTKTLNAIQYDKLLSYLVISLYTTNRPRRNLDFLVMWIRRSSPKKKLKGAGAGAGAVEEVEEIPEASRNYYDVPAQEFIFNRFKTAKFAGTETEEVVPELQEVLALFLKYHPLMTEKGDIKMLVKYDGTPITAVNAITRILNKFFGKNIGSSALRHIFLSEKYGKVMKEMAEDTKAMGHSSEAAIRDYVKTDV